ncbi:hypothetical protein [Yinghuangia seranimata]|uniref:hypothetical protein n=1 Tax=Yinghuangia seranimata TaxID=408067 RepID=UPI00248A949B|nr:hypothetical protein [Yinghuangia seranimata]MDI2132009.1 hypothetical protein [Yinghuangia seranimata]
MERPGRSGKGDAAHRGGADSPPDTPPDDAKGTEDASDDKAGDRTGEHDRVADALRSPLADAAAAPGSVDAIGDAARTYQQSRNLFNVRGTNLFFDKSTLTHAQIGGSHTHHHYGAQATAGALVLGPVPADELDRLDRVYQPVEERARMAQVLAERRLVVLSGRPGTGREFTALSLLRKHTGDRVMRMDPTALGDLQPASFAERHGYVVRVASDTDAITELRLDRLRALLSDSKAYLTVVVDEAVADERVLRGRYSVPCVPPDPEATLRRHLVALTVDADPEAEVYEDYQEITDSVTLAADPEIREAIGLDELRPRETAWLAGLLESHARGALTREELLRECRLFARGLVSGWFQNIECRDGLPEGFPALRTAALRIAIAVFNGASYNQVAEAAELLAWELAATLDPEHVVGRPLFTDDLRTSLAAARAEIVRGEEEIGGVAVPVRAVRFQGEALTAAVLGHVWDRFHNVRGPIVRWLLALGLDPRPQVWVRASLAAGLLTALDFTYGFHELIRPTALSASAQNRLFAANALALAGGETELSRAVKVLVRDWGRGDHPELRCTAAFAHGRGVIAGSVAASLDELARIGCGTPEDLDDMRLAEASYGVVQLLGTREPGEVVDRICTWMEDDRVERRDLALVCAIRMARTPASEVYDALTSPVLGDYGEWPLMLALAAAHEDIYEPIADLMMEALYQPRSREAALEAFDAWVREGAEDRVLGDLIADFLPDLVYDENDCDRLVFRLLRLMRDADAPLDVGFARRLRDAIRKEMD